MDKKKFNQYGKIKMYITACFWAFSMSVTADTAKNPVDKNRISDEAVKVDIIINKEDINEFEGRGIEEEEDTYSEEGDLIFLDQIKDKEEEESQKKLEKTNRLERFIRKIDEKVNPTIKFQVAKSYGTWYLLKTDSISEANLESVRYDFTQQENGYQITKSYFNPDTGRWYDEGQRAWIQEKKGHVYLNVEKKYFKNNSNEILFFDRNYRYMVIRYNDGVTRVFSRYPNNEKISLEDEELDEFEKIIGKNTRLRNVVYDINVKNLMETERGKKREEARRKTEELEKRLNENSVDVFQIDTVGARKYIERRAKRQQKENLKNNSGAEGVPVIELKEEDLKNNTESTEKNNGN